MSSTPANLGASAIRLSGGQLVTRLISFLWIAYFSRAAGPADFGIYTTVMSFFSLAVPLANLGTGASVMRRASKNAHLGQELFGSLFWIRSILTMVLSAAILGGFRFYGYPVSYWPLFVLASFYFVFTGWSQIAEAIYVVNHRTILLALSQLFTAIVWAASGTVAWRTTHRMDAVFAALVVSSIATDLLHSGFLSSTKLWPTFALNRALIREQLVQAAPISMVSILTLASERLDRILLSWQSDPTTVGYFGLASLIVLTTVEVVWQPFLIVLYSIINRAAEQDDGGKALRWIGEKGTLWSCMAALPLVAGLWFFAPAVVRHFWGVHYDAAIPILKLFACALPFFAYNKLLANFMLAYHRDKEYLGVNIGLFTLYLVGNLIFIPRFGAMGAAGVMVASHAAATLGYLFFLHRRLPGFWHPDRLGTLIFLSAACFLPLMAWEKPRAWGIIAFAIFAGVAYRIVFSTEDRAIASRWIKHLHVFQR